VRKNRKMCSLESGRARLERRGQQAKSRSRRSVKKELKRER
jgi:hypothetical protein